jgi:restriction endonuclease S subunit
VQYLRTYDLIEDVDYDKRDIKHCEKPPADCLYKSATDIALTIEGFTRPDGKTTVGLPCFKGEGILNNHVVLPVSKDANRLDTRFGQYTSISEPNRLTVKLLAKGAISMSSGNSLRELWACLPPLEEQSQIATFLDRETTRIDTLVEKKQRFIELLEEKRQAVITHAVTKGLDPNVPMKDSGVEWIGEVPAHWEVKRLKRVCKLQTDQVSAVGQAVALENIEGWTGRLLEVEQGSDTEGVSFKEGDVLFGKLRPYLAKVHLAEADGVAVGDFFVLRLTEGLPSYLWRYLLSPPLIDLLNGATVGAKMPRVSWQYMASTFAPVPPHREQSQIATFLDRETTRIDTLIEKTRQSIELLKERRSALITAAVTGKIDVREEVA